MVGEDKKTILIIEDHEQLIDLYIRVLKSEYKILAVTKSEEALPHLDSADVIVSDWEQPASKGGKGLLDYMRANKIDKPVIIVSGLNLTPEDWVGAKEFMLKPLDPADLAARVRKYAG